MLSDLEITAKRIYDEYTRTVGIASCRRQRLPESFFDLSRLQRGRVIQAAQSCMTMGVDPEEYVKTAFLKTRKNTQQLLLTDIINGGKVIEAWQHQKHAGLRVEREWLHMCREAKHLAALAIPSRYADLVDLLLDPLQPFKAYFRVLYPEEGIYKDLFDVYGETAREQLGQDLKLRAYLRTVRGTNIERLAQLTRPFTDAMLEGEYNG